MRNVVRFTFLFLGVFFLFFLWGCASGSTLVWNTDGTFELKNDEVKKADNEPMKNVFVRERARYYMNRLRFKDYESAEKAAEIDYHSENLNNPLVKDYFISEQIRESMQKGWFQNEESARKAAEYEYYSTRGKSPNQSFLKP